MKHLVWLLLLVTTTPLMAQTAEDSLQNSTAKEKQTYISGYGEAKVSYNTRYRTAQANLTRAVVFIGHKFNSRISFFSETELESARVEGGKPGGEISMEQAYLRFDLNRTHYLQAGLFIPRIGIINENHLPTTFNGNDRPFTETLLIPSTWREIGIGFYGSSDRLQGLSYSLALVNGLNSGDFVNGSGIREGRFEGSNATASNIALTGSVTYLIRDFTVQMSAYYGGSAGLNNREADSLQLNSGLFGTPVSLGEINIRYNHNRFAFRALGAALYIPDAQKINRAYANNTAELAVGGYGEVSYRVFTKTKTTAFLRYEAFNLNQEIPENGIRNNTLNQQYIIAGFSVFPAPGVVIKADYVYKQTGRLNPALNPNPFPNAPPYYTSNSFINLGLGYSF
ncbi:MAG TPA: hypothetical protein PKN14_06920 [Bacteroidia bacterium]|nr:hypothetical protein [Bacteroidia bacterium]HNT82695.1 hypothetical protein [Bacteroidia bacterium]HRV52662.1 hypothetical protein [Bacteroidia bacterium]